MNKTLKQENKKILPRDVNAALRELVRLSKKLVEFTDRETQALVVNDHLSFAFIGQDKESLAERYMQASEEFRIRLEEFRGADKSLLAQLNQYQEELKEKTQSNNIIIGQLKDRAAANTKTTLFTVQELGQRVSFSNENTQQAKGRV